MSTANFLKQCNVCLGEIDNFTQHIKFIFTEDELVQEHEYIQMPCGCVIDFPDWQIDSETGICKIYNFAGTLFLTFYDKEMLLTEDEDDE